MKTTRRSFVAAAGAASSWALGLFRPRGALAAAPPPVDAGLAGTRPDAGGPPAPSSLAQLARDRYGKYLDEAQLKMLEARLREVEARSKQLHAFKLSYGDEPACDFRAVRR